MSPFLSSFQAVAPPPPQSSSLRWWRQHVVEVKMGQNHRGGGFSSFSSSICPSPPLAPCSLLTSQPPAAAGLAQELWLSPASLSPLSQSPSKPSSQLSEPRRSHQRRRTRSPALPGHPGAPQWEGVHVKGFSFPLMV